MGATKGPSVRVDWQAYWQAFKEAHGDPVEFEGRLLFADGWTYARSDVRGPEWPPPDDPRELRRLQLGYWRTRLRVVAAERDLLRALVRQLRALQESRSAPLRHRVRLWDDEAGRYRVELRDVDPVALEQGRLAWLEEDVRECEGRLAELQGQGSTTGANT